MHSTVRDDIHRLRIVNTFMRNMKECGDSCFNVIQCVELDSSLVFPKQSPFKDAHARIYRGRVKRKNYSSKFEDFRDSTSLRLRDHLIFELLEDSIDPVDIRLGEVSPKGNILNSDERLWLGLRILHRGDYRVWTIAQSSSRPTDSSR